MTTFLPGLWLIVGLELRQRVRGAAWYVLIGIFAVVLLAVTVLFTWFTVSTPGADSGGPLYSVIMYIVLLLSTLMTPALSGSAINGDRDTGTLATTQVTLITTGQLVLGKFIAAWVSALAFLVVSLPFIIVAVTLGGLSPLTIVTSVLILVAELGIFAAIGVGLSGLLNRPLFSVVVSYLVIAALCVGSLISFGLLTIVTRSDVVVTQTSVSSTSGDPATADPSQIQCDPPTTYTYPVPRYDYYWWLLASNPYVVVADATPGSFTTARDAVRPLHDHRNGCALGPARARPQDDPRRLRQCEGPGERHPGHPEHAVAAGDLRRLGPVLVRRPRRARAAGRGTARGRVRPHPHPGTAALEGKPHRLTPDENSWLAVVLDSTHA